MNTRSEKAEFLRRFLKYCYAPDLDRLTPVERSLMLKELSGPIMVIGTNDLLLPLEHFPDLEGGHWRRDLEQTRKSIVEALDWIFEKIDENFALRLNVPYFFLKAMDKFFFDIETMFLERLVQANAYRQSTYPPEEPAQTKMVHLAFVKFLESLSDFPQTSLFRCPQCMKISFNPTKRKKTYCSKECQNSAGVERFRKKKHTQDTGQVL